MYFPLKYSFRKVSLTLCNSKVGNLRLIEKILCHSAFLQCFAVGTNDSITHIHCTTLENGFFNYNSILFFVGCQTSEQRMTSMDTTSSQHRHH